MISMSENETHGRIQIRKEADDTLLCGAKHSTKRCKEGANRRGFRFFSLAFHNSLRACCAGARRAGRTDCWRRASDLWAAWTRARGAFSCRALSTRAFACIHNNGLGRRNACLENILRKVSCRRALRLQHVVFQIRHGSTWRNAALQNIF